MKLPETIGEMNSDCYWLVQYQLPQIMPKQFLVSLVVMLWPVIACWSQEANEFLDRRPLTNFSSETISPEEFVENNFLNFSVAPRLCRERKILSANLRQSISELALQEWAYFGFNFVDEFSEEYSEPIGLNRAGAGRDWLDAKTAERVTSSIAGYWASTKDGSWIVQEQNISWLVDIDNYDWDAPWSASFISWIICELGLTEEEFSRSIAHHHYIDQAIRDRLNGENTPSAYRAYRVGEKPLNAGDLLCRARRSQYLALEERISDLGIPARTHCDILISIEDNYALVIGGNIRDAVSLKRIPLERLANGNILSIGSPYRKIFVHLSLKSDTEITIKELDIFKNIIDFINASDELKNRFNFFS